MQNLLQCKDTNITLPRLNDADDNPFVQKTAIDLRCAELETVEEVFTQLNEANFTMDKELEILNGSITSTGNPSRNNNANANVTIPHDALIVYVENETAPLPEIIIELLKGCGTREYPLEEWYIYGIKNPESFYKSFLLLTRIDFIIKNKTEKKNDVATFKREMALHYEAFYKGLEYRKLRLPHHDMIHKLTSMDNYCEYDALRFLCDFSRVNIVLLDIIERKYLDIHYTSHALMTGIESSITTMRQGEFIVIIKYANDTYLPLMNSKGQHIFKISIIEYIRRNYERVVVEKYKEPSKSQGLDIDTGIEVTTEINLSGVEDSSNEYESLEETGNILDSKTVSVFFNNTIPVDSESVDINPIIRAGEFSMAIEDMIEISEEQVPSVIKTEQQHANISNMLSSTHTPKIETPLSTHDPANAHAPAHAFDVLMAMIPSKAKPETSVSDGVNASKSTKQSKSCSKITKKSTNLVETVSPIMEPADSVNTDETINNSNKDFSTDELKPIKTYNLLDLQMLARLYKVDTQKEGKIGKKVNKTKDELYNEIKAVLERQK